MFTNLLRAGLLALLCLHAPQASAQTPLDFVRKGDYAAARSELARKVKGRRDAPLHAALLEALILEHKGDLSAAVSLLRQILAIAPRFEPARHVLAAALARMGDQRAALFQAERLAATTTDARLRAQLHQEISAMGGGKRSGLELRFSLLPSSNANHATASQSVTLGGTPFILDPSSRRIPGIGASFGVTAWQSWLLSEDWAAIGSLSVDRSVYNRAALPRQTSLGARLEINGRIGRAALSFGPRAGRVWQDATRYFDRLGLRVAASFSLSRRAALGLDASYDRQWYPSESYRSGDLLALTPSLTYRPSQSWIFAVGLPLAREQTRRDFLDHRDLGLQFTVAHARRGGLHLRLNLGLGRARYRGTYPGMGIARNDRTVTAGLVVSDDRLHIGKLVPEFSFTRTIVMSNVGIQSYQSNDFGLAFVRRF